MEQRALFTAREATGRRRLGWYAPRGHAVSVGVRHGSGDLYILEEVFGAGLYEPPSAVTTLLGGIPAPRVLDLGGHVGLFALFALERWPASTVTSYEPDPANLAVLEQARVRNGLARRWTVEGACAGAAEGVADFAALGDSVSHVARAGEPGRRTPVADVLPELLGADLVKIDIEGSEWAILRDPRFARGGPAALVLEYHPDAGAADASAARERAASLLGAAGYEVRDAVAPTADAGVLWAWREAT